MERETGQWLNAVHALVCRQHEMVPFIHALQPPAEMRFRPLPDAMLAQLRTSTDWRLPECGVPTLMMLETEEESGGLLIVADADANLFVLVPI